jgi:hypothetical protein
MDESEVNSFTEYIKRFEPLALLETGFMMFIGTEIYNIFSAGFEYSSSSNV